MRSDELERRLLQVAAGEGLGAVEVQHRRTAGPPRVELLDAKPGRLREPPSQEWRAELVEPAHAVEYAG